MLEQENFGKALNYIEYYPTTPGTSGFWKPQSL